MLIDLIGTNIVTVTTACLISDFLFRRYLDLRQYRFLCSKPSADTLRLLDEATALRSSEYSREKLARKVLNNARVLAISLATLHFQWISRLYNAWAQFTGSSSDPVVGALVTLSLAAVDSITYIPVELHRIFVTEQNFGFNRQSLAGWLRDKLITWTIGIPLTFGVNAGVLYIIGNLGNLGPVMMSGFIATIVFFVQMAYPVIYVPLFYQLKPLENSELRDEIGKLIEKAGKPFDGNISVMNASSRSSHNNAFFAGSRWNPHIVLYDITLEGYSTREVVAVVAHELGHWNESHLMKHTALLVVLHTAVRGLLPSFVANPALYASLGFVGKMAPSAAFAVYELVSKPLQSARDAVETYVSRYHETQADDCAVNWGYGKELYDGFLKDFREEFESVDADPAYSSFTHSHPLPVERLRNIAAKLAGSRKQE